MAKIFIDKDRLQSLLNVYDKKFENKDYLGALLTVDSIEKASDDKAFIAVKRAKCYFEMGRYAQAVDEWFKYLNVVKSEKNYARAYNALGACFFKMDDEKVASYYFNRQIMSDKKAVFDYSYVTAEFFESMLSTDKNYYLAYPFDKADMTATLKEAEDLLKGGDYDGALNILSIIPESSKFYATSLITTSIAKYFKGDAQGAIEDIERSISLEPNVISVCNAISMFTAEKMDEKAEKYMELLKNLPVTSGEDVYKISMIYCERGDDETACSYAKTYLKENPYDAPMLLLYGIMNYNLKRFETAEQSFLKAYQITRSSVCKYYIDLIKKNRLERFEYTFDLQAEDRLKIMRKIGSFMKASSEERLIRQSEVYDLSAYAFYSNSYQLQSSIITLLGELATENAIEIMKKALISMSVYDRIKSGVLGFLTADGCDEEIGAVFGNVFRKIKFYKADFGAQDTVFTEAYAYVFAKLAPMEKDMKPIYLSAISIYEKIKEKGLLLEIKDVRSLSAVMYELSSIAKIKSRREFANFFEGNLREIKRIKSLIQD
ncbi:MAG: hypothetical protein IKJ14_03440 [Clostridia bacterium]|nr:hypothetical protein [Clostridia bacterium]